MNIINDCNAPRFQPRGVHCADGERGLQGSLGKVPERNITYTTPSGWQCRDRLLFGDKYLKENMEYEFRIREEIIYGRAHGPETGPEPSPQPTARESSSPITPIVIQCPLPEALTMLTQKTESIGWEVRGMREYLPNLRSHTQT